MEKPKRGSSDQPDLSVSEYEGLALGLIQRRQPITRYQVYKSFHRAPLATPNASKGSLYPLIGRLMRRGFVCAESGTNARNAELLSVTDLGRAAIRDWVFNIDSTQALEYDPIEAKLLSLSQLTRHEQLRWVVKAKELIMAKRRELDEYQTIVLAVVKQADLPFFEIARLGGNSALDSKLRWMDQLMTQIALGETPHLSEAPARRAKKPAGRTGRAGASTSA